MINTSYLRQSAGEIIEFWDHFCDVSFCCCCIFAAQLNLRSRHAFRLDFCVLFTRFMQ